MEISKFSRIRNSKKRKMKKNILFVSYLYLDVHLCKTSRFSILQELNKLDNNCTLHSACIDDKNIVKIDNIDMSYVLLPGVQILNFITYQIKSFFLIPKVIYKNKIDTIICDINSTPSIFLLLILKKMRIININFILDFRSNIMHHRKNKFQNFLKKYYLIIILNFSNLFYDGFTFITEGFKNILEKTYKISFNNYIFWSSGVPNYFFDSSLKKEESNFIILHHGHLERGRGIMRLIDAMKYLKNNLSDKITLKIAGSGNLEDDIKSLSIKKEYKLQFLGIIDHKDIVSLIDSSDLCIVPFDNSIGNATSSPLKLMEYVARNKSIIATKLENFLNDFKDYDSLYYIKNNNPKSIAESIDRYIFNYKNYPKGTSNQGQMLIKKKFTWEIQAKKIDNFLETF